MSQTKLFNKIIISPSMTLFSKIISKAFSTFVIIVLICTSYLATADSKTITVGIDEYPPWNITTGKTLQGINVEIISRLAERLKLDIDFQICPWKRCLKMMNNGKLDLIAGVLKRPDREEYMYFINPPYKNKSNKVFYVNPKTDVKISRYEDLYKYRLGVVNGAKYFDQFDNDSKLLKTPVTKDDQLVGMLLKQRLDAYVGTETQADYYLYKNNLASQFNKAKFRHAKPTAVYMTLSKKSHLANQLNHIEKQLSLMIKEGEISNIIAGFYQRLEKNNNPR